MMTQDYARFHSRLRLVGTLELLTSLHIGAGDTDNIAAADITVIKDVTGAPYIPGSSFKGVLRSHIEGVLRAIDDSEERNLACLCVTIRKGETSGCPTTRDPARGWPDLEALKKRIQQKKDGPDALDNFYLTKSCRVCQVFGSPNVASKVLIRDLPLTDAWLGHYQIRDGVSIDRDTETAAEGRLYSFEAVPAGTTFRCDIVVQNASEAEQGMLLLGLKGFEHGHLTLGGGTSRGLGRVKLAWNWKACGQVNGDNPTALVDFLLSDKMDPLDSAAFDVKIRAFRDELGV